MLRVIDYYWRFKFKKNVLPMHETKHYSYISFGHSFYINPYKPIYVSIHQIIRVFYTQSKRGFICACSCLSALLNDSLQNAHI